jgi:hypothetical protein
MRSAMSFKVTIYLVQHTHQSELDHAKQDFTTCTLRAASR